MPATSDPADGPSGPSRARATPGSPRWGQRLASLLTPRVREQLDWMGYTLGDVVGGGAFGVVLRAHDRKLERPIAIKLIELPDTLRAGAPVARDEMRLLANLRHPHVVPLFTAGTLDQRMLYLVMPWIPGSTLRQRLIGHRTLTVDETLRIGIDLADALAALHGQGLVHRDVKPDNVMLEGDHAMLIDLGLVCAARAEPLVDPDDSYVIGTPAYMSPEQWRAGDAIDGRADVYALGCLLFELLTGEPPYTPKDRDDRRPNPHRWTESIRTRDDLSGWQATFTGPVASVARHRADVPREIDRLLQKAMAPERTKRFASAQALREALEGAQHHRHRRPWQLGAQVRLVVGGLAATLLVGLALGWRFVGPSAPSPAAERSVALASGTLDDRAVRDESSGAFDPRRVLVTPVLNRTRAPGTDTLATRLSVELERALLAPRPSATVVFVPAAVPLPIDSLNRNLLATVGAVARTERTGLVLAATLDTVGVRPVLRLDLLDVATGRVRRRLPATVIPTTRSDSDLQRVVQALAVAVHRAVATDISSDNEQ